MNTGKDIRYKEWLKAVEIWAKRHDMSVKSAISALFDDHPNWEDDLIVKKDLYWAECDEFAGRYVNEQYETKR